MLKPKPTIERLRFLFEDRNGILYWMNKSDPHSAKKPGDKAGRINANGYVTVGVDGMEIKGHIIVWAIHYGQYPEGMIDHINGIACDNRIDNLRIANSSENNANRSSQEASTSKYLGVCWKKEISRWRASISKDNTVKHLGYFLTEEQAAAAYNMAAAKLHEEYARLNQLAA